MAIGRVEQHRMDFLGADDGDRDDWGAGPQRHLYEATTSEALHAVTVAKKLGSSFHAFGENPDQLVALEQCHRIVRVSQDVAGSGQEN